MVNVRSAGGRGSDGSPVLGVPTKDPLSDRILMGDFSTGDEVEVDVDPEGDKLSFKALSRSKA